MKNIILIVTLLIFAGCSNDEDKVSNDIQTSKKALKKVVIKEPKVVAKTTKSGEEVYKACVACHGVKGDKAALGKSKIIKGWDAAKVSAAINGYKDGTYGGPMQALMIGQVGFLSDEEVKSVSDYISKL